MTDIQRGRRLWRFVVAGLVLAILVFSGIAAAATGVFSDNDAAEEPDAVGTQVTGDRAQWTAAVCEPNSDLATSSTFLYPDATDIAYCAARSSEATAPHSVVIGEWPHDADLEGDIARLGTVHWFATVPAGERRTVFILLDSPDRALLEPLAPFGFTISPAA